MIENYEELTVDETLEVVDELGDDEIEQFIEYERDHKNRTTVIDPLEELLSDSDESGDTGTAEPETVTVTVEVGNYGGGIFFDDATETKTVERTTRVQQALDNGNLTEVT